MNKFFLFFLVACSALALAQGRYIRDNSGRCCIPKCCGENEVYKQCGVEATCTNPKPCQVGGKPGCYCKCGYVRECGVCIPLCKCCKCPKNEERRIDTCDATCDDPCKKRCECNCKPKCGCFCIDGYVRNCHGVCIPKCKCCKY